MVLCEGQTSLNTFLVKTYVITSFFSLLNFQESIFWLPYRLSPFGYMYDLCRGNKELSTLPRKDWWKKTDILACLNWLFSYSIILFYIRWVWRYMLQFFANLPLKIEATYIFPYMCTWYYIHIIELWLAYILNFSMMMYTTIHR